MVWNEGVGGVGGGHLEYNAMARFEKTLLRGNYPERGFWICATLLIGATNCIIPIGAYKEARNVGSFGVFAAIVGCSTKAGWHKLDCNFPGKL